MLGDPPERELPRRKACWQGKTALEQKDYSAALASAGEALKLVPGDFEATKLQTTIQYEQLAAEGILSAEEARALRGGDAFLRAVESRLRLERDQPGEALDAEREKLAPLARRLGYEGTDDEAVAALLEDHAHHRETVRAIYDRRLATPRT